MHFRMRLTGFTWTRLRGTLGVLAMVLCVAASVTAGGTGESNKDKFAQCLKAKQATMYGDFRCPHCADQKEMFGASFKYVSYVECGIKGQPMRVQQQACRELQIKDYPTWTFPDGDRLVGPQTLQKLGEKTGCTLP
jgi:hypothetical protein